MTKKTEIQLSVSSPLVLKALLIHLHLPSDFGGRHVLQAPG
jgi:hypothetical protein